MSNVIPLRSSDDVYDDAFSQDGYLNTVAECRRCGKLIGVKAQWLDGTLQIMSTGGPIFGKCPSKRTYPACGDSFAAVAFVAEAYRETDDDEYRPPYALDPKEIR